MDPVSQNVRFNWLIFLSFVAIYLVWGSTYLAIRIALECFPPFLLAGIRFLTAGMILLIWSLIKLDAIPPIRELVKISLTGILLLFFGTGSVIWVEQHLTTSLISIVWATLPVWLIVFDRDNWLRNFSDLRIPIGVILGFIGVLILSRDNELHVFSGIRANSGFIIAVGGTIAYAIGSVILKNKLLKGHTAFNADVQMVVAGLLSLLCAFLIKEQYEISLHDLTYSGISALVYLIIMGSLVAYLAYIYLISVMSPVIVGTYAYVYPGIATLLGWLVVSEKISCEKIIALMVILTGVLVLNIYTTKK